MRKSTLTETKAPWLVASRRTTSPHPLVVRNDELSRYELEMRTTL
jgi:hypothetical protein